MNERERRRSLLHIKPTELNVYISDSVFFNMRDYEPGGAIHINAGNQVADLRRSIFSSCSSFKTAGAIYMNGKELTCDECCGMHCIALRYSNFMDLMLSKKIIFTRLAFYGCSDNNIASKAINSICSGKWSVKMINCSHNYDFVDSGSGAILDTPSSKETSIKYAIFNNNTGGTVLYLGGNAFHTAKYEYIEFYDNKVWYSTIRFTNLKLEMHLIYHFGNFVFNPYGMNLFIIIDSGSAEIEMSYFDSQLVPAGNFQVKSNVKYTKSAPYVVNTYFIDECADYKNRLKPTTEFTRSNIFTSNYFSKSEQFTKSDMFSTHLFTQSNKFTKSNLFSTNYFSKSEIFTHSNMFSTQMFTKSNEFSQPDKFSRNYFSKSNEFTASHVFSNVKPTSIVEIVILSRSNTFTPSNTINIPAGAFRPNVNQNEFEPLSAPQAIGVAGGVSSILIIIAILLMIIYIRQKAKKRKLGEFSESDNLLDDSSTGTYSYSYEYYYVSEFTYNSDIADIDDANAM